MKSGLPQGAISILRAVATADAELPPGAQNVLAVLELRGYCAKTDEGCWLVTERGLGAIDLATTATK